MHHYCNLNSVIKIITYMTIAVERTCYCPKTTFDTEMSDILLMSTLQALFT
jgi:hypothetical protein